MQKHTHTQRHTTRKVPLWINNTDPHTKNWPTSLSIMRCHKQPFSSVVLSGTIKICVTQAGCCSPGGATGKHAFRRTQKHISAFLSHTADHDKASSGCFRSLSNYLKPHNISNNPHLQIKKKHNTLLNVRFLID